MGFAKAARTLPPDLVDEMGRLTGCGLSLVPLGAGQDGKSPLIAFSRKPRLELRQVLGPMNRAQSACFGIRLDGLLVLDLDTDDPALVKKLEARFGASPVHVRTPRGRHVYYRDPGCRPNLKAEGLPVDVKAGANQYVVGAKSVRPDGGEYFSAKGILGEAVLPTLQDVTNTHASNSRINVGQRNNALWQASIQMVECVDDADELFENLRHLADEECADPQTVTDAELRRIAKWACNKRCSNSIYAGRQSAIRIEREVLDILHSFPNFSDALGLFVTLQDKHGHIPGRTFALSHQPMREARLTDLSRDKFSAARKTLTKAGLLSIAAQHQAGQKCRQYRLTRPVRTLAENLIALRTGKGGEEGL